MKCIKCIKCKKETKEVVLWKERFKFEESGSGLGNTVDWCKRCEGLCFNEIRYSDLSNPLRWFVALGWAVIVWLTIVNAMGILIVGGWI